MKSFRKNLVTITFFIAGLLFLFVSLPYVIAGPPTPLFTVQNKDIGNHELRVEIFDSENNLVIERTYELSEGQRISENKPFRFFVPGFEIVDYIFKFTLDKSFERTYCTNMQPWNTVEIDISSDGQLLSIGEITV